MEKIINNKGITLVALVITIIILLILAGISIQAITNTGLFANVQKSNNELMEVLLGLGYKQADVKKVITKVDINNTLEEQIKEALRLLLK